MNDMTRGKPRKILIAFILPLLLGNIFQQMYQMVDSIVVGQFVGANALAAVGSMGTITYLSITLGIGLSVGASILIGQLFGAGEEKSLMEAVNTGLGFSLLLGGVLTVLGLLVTEPLLRAMNTPAEVFEYCKIYLSIYFCGMIFSFGYNMLSAVFRSLGDSKSPFVFLLISSAINIVLDLIFVAVFGLEVAGVAIATAIAQMVSFVLAYLKLKKTLLQLNPKNRISIVKGFSLPMLQRTVKLAIPSSMQSIIIAGSLTVLQSMVNQFGPLVMAAYAACGRIESFCMMPMTSISSSTSAFTAQNIGAGKPERIKEGLKSALMFSAIICLVIIVLVTLLGGNLIGLFVSGEDALQVIEIGIPYLRILAVAFVAMAILFPFEGILQGAGDVNCFLVFAISGAAARLLFPIVMMPVMGYTAIWYSVIISWCVEGIGVLIRYASGRWKTIKVVNKKSAPSIEYSAESA